MCKCYAIVWHDVRTYFKLLSISRWPEFIQTEMHHVRTLKILLHVYMYELKQFQLIEEAKLERLFRGLEALLNLHNHFLNCLKLRQSQSQENGNVDNYQITQFGDILVSQVGSFYTRKLNSSLDCQSDWSLWIPVHHLQLNASEITCIKNDCFHLWPFCLVLQAY